jgi:hypothetical protein
LYEALEAELDEDSFPPPTLPPRFILLMLS